MGPDRFAVVIPVFNHAGTVAAVAQMCRDLRLPVFVVDDGSTDGTYGRVRALEGVTVLRHTANRGKGAAILTGFAAAAAVADWVVTIDADGQHHPEDIPGMIGAIPPGWRPIVLGRREGMTAGADVPWTSRFGRSFSNFWVWASGGPCLTDSQSGLRIYPVPEAAGLDVKARRFEFEVEVLVLAHRRGIPVLEAPVRVTYQPAGQRVSHYRPFLDFMRNSGTFSRLILARIFLGR